MDDFDLDLGVRLAALEARAPSGGNPPSLAVGTGRRRMAVSLALGPLLALLLVATAAGSVVLVSSLVRGYPGIESPGQPLAGARLECLAPPEAASFLTQHGYVGVVWEVTTSSGGGYQTTTPPEHGYVNPGAILGDGRLHMVIDQRAGGGVGACSGNQMP